LQTLHRYALADHVLSAVSDLLDDWLLMDEVVLSWIHGTLTTELQDIVCVPDDTAHRIWGALEAQFLGHRQTRILYLETAFRRFAQGRSLCGRVLPSDEDDGRHYLHPRAPHHRQVPRAQPPPWLEPSLRSCDAHPHSHEAFSHLCGDQERSSSRGALPLRHCDRHSRHDALQRSSGSPLCLQGGSSSPHSGPPPPRALRPPTGSGGSRSWPRPWSQEWTRWPAGRPRPFTGWLPVAILLQPVDWHHPDVARAIHEHLGPSPRHPSAGFLCRSTSGSTLGTFLAIEGLLPLPGSPAPPVWGPWTNGWDTQS
jgi:hypothetical protein